MFAIFLPKIKTNKFQGDRRRYKSTKKISIGSKPKTFREFVRNKFKKKLYSKSAPDQQSIPRTYFFYGHIYFVSA